MPIASEDIDQNGLVIGVSPERFRKVAMPLLFDHLNAQCEGTIAVNRQARIVWINDKYAEKVGIRDPRSVLGKEIEEVLPASRLREVVQNVVAAFGATARFLYERNYPVTVNHPEQTEKAVAVAAEVAGEGNVSANTAPVMGGEDFAFMLEARPGAFIFIGNGDSAGLHHPAYDFNDAAIPYGASYWARLVERLMPAG